MPEKEDDRALVPDEKRLAQAVQELSLSVANILKHAAPEEQVEILSSRATRAPAHQIQIQLGKPAT